LKNFILNKNTLNEKDLRKITSDMMKSELSLFFKNKKELEMGLKYVSNLESYNPGN